MLNINKQKRFDCTKSFSVWVIDGNKTVYKNVVENCITFFPVIGQFTYCLRLTALHFCMCHGHIFFLIFKVRRYNIWWTIKRRKHERMSVARHSI